MGYECAKIYGGVLWGFVLGAKVKRGFVVFQKA